MKLVVGEQLNTSGEILLQNTQSVREAIALGLEVRAMVRKIDEHSEALARLGAVR
jgi:hypothetical protein